MSAAEVWDELATGGRNHDTKCRHKDGPTHGGVCRDKWQKPIILLPDGKRTTAYYRASSYADMIESKFTLDRWNDRMLATGLVQRNDLLMAAAANLDNKRELNDVCDQAKNAAGANNRATIGTSLHKLCEAHDLGNTPEHVPNEFAADLDAYIKTMHDNHLSIRAVDVEVFGVHDEVKAAGSADRYVTHQGRRFVADIKSGDSLDFGLLKMEAQLAIYSRMARYDYETGARSSLGSVDRSNGIIIHLPAGSGICELHWVNLRNGWETVKLAAAVRARRSAKSKTVKWATP